MTKTVNIDFIGKKAVDVDSPYAVFTGQMFGGEATFKVLKKYKNDDAAQYSAWMIAAETPATYGGYDMGDTYVTDVVTTLNLTEVDGRPPTEDELGQIGTLRSALVSDGLSQVFTMVEIQMGAKPKGVESDTPGIRTTTISLKDGTVTG